ncbi:serine--tRNA ligase [Patescibacteria group bacterium]
MIDIKKLREDPEIYKQVVRDKGIDLDIDKFLSLDKSRSEMHQEVENIRRERNELDDKIKKADEKSRPDLIDENKVLKDKLGQIEPKLKEIDKKYELLLRMVPLPPASDVPVGDDDSQNKEIRKEGTIPKFDFQYLDHIELGKKLDILDFPLGVKISGSRGYVLKNEGVLLQFAVLRYALEVLKEHGFTLTIPPVLIKEFALTGSGHFPFDTENIYRAIEQEHLEKSDKQEPLYLAGTSEPSLLAMYANETLRAENLPVKLSGFSPCYRSEVGSYGKDTKGLYRVHEFWKVEQVVICANSEAESDKWQQKLLRISEDILEGLELPYRVVINCTGDMGAGKYRMYDLETWMPSREAYGETHSDSALHDWQARRLNLKYRTKEGKKMYAHTLNNTGVASPRILIPLLENHQQADGSVKVPKMLQSYCGLDIIVPKEKC